MNSLLYLLLQLQLAQIALNKAQSAHSHTVVTRTYTAPKPVATAQSPVANTLTPVTSLPIAAQPGATPPAPAPVTSAPIVSQPAQLTATAPAPSQNSGDFRSQVEAYVLSDTNVQRAQNGLPALTPDSQVAAVARAHSDDMMTNNYFAHNALNGCDPGCRLTNAGYRWMSYGENIHWMEGYNLSAADSAQKIVTDWMNSPPHRENLLGAFKYVGIGISINGSKIDSTADYTTQ